MNDVGKEMHDLCRELFPISRSLTGDGVRETLAILQRYLPQLKIHEIPTGSRVFDWEIPQEWVIRDAWLETPHGKRICRFQDNNLHVVGYSVPVDTVMPLSQLEEHLFSLPEFPNAIPYVTSYYSRRWGFCLTHEQREKLVPGDYRVFIDSELVDGSLTYADLVLPGESPEEVLVSTYVCHPSMANNELSGPAVATFLARWLGKRPSLRKTVRFVFVPETIGAIAYIAGHLEELKQNVIAGFVLTCIGDDMAYSYLSSRQENTLADLSALHVLKRLHPEFKRYSFLDRGSDERQYCSPGVDLPVCSVMRSKYGTFPQYHTSLDNLELVTPSGLAGGLEAMQRILECVEGNEILKTTVCCEPQLGKRGLYPTMSTRTSGLSARMLTNLLAYCDGTMSTLEIAEKIDVPLWELGPKITQLKEAGLLEEV